MQMNEFLFSMILTELEDAVGKENCSVKEIDKLTHSVDYYWLSRMWADRGRRMPEADFVVAPKDAQETSKVLKIANYYKIPVTTWGAGGGSQGGALPVCGGIILDTKRMNKIYEVNTEAMYIECGTGCIYKHLEWAANEVGKATMHYPSSIACSTVGGFLAHRGIGVCSNKYGKIDDMVLQMEVVLPNGDIIYTSPTPKHAVGPDLNQIFIGSEGTLGVITKAQMRIYDQPEERRFRAFLFQDMDAAFKASKELLQKFKPSVIILLTDKWAESIPLMQILAFSFVFAPVELENLQAIKAIGRSDIALKVEIIKKVVGVERKGAFMNIAYEGLTKMVDVEEEILLETFAKYGAEDLGSEYGEKWWKEKLTFFYPGHALDLPKLYGTMDTIAPYGKIEKIYYAMKEAIETNFPQAKFIAHFSHWYEWGAMMYDRFIVDPEFVPEDPEEALRLHQAIWTTGIRAALENGGVVNDHHGVGIKLGRYVKEQYGPAMQVLEGIKKQLDPNGIMNPFKLGL